MRSPCLRPMPGVRLHHCRPREDRWTVFSSSTRARPATRGRGGTCHCRSPRERARQGFTALDGIPMGTRPGQIDPGVILYLIEQKKMSAAAVSAALAFDVGG